MMNNTKVHWPSFVRNNKFNDYYETWKVVWGGGITTIVVMTHYCGVWHDQSPTEVFAA